MHLLSNYDDDGGGGTEYPHVRHYTGEFDRSVVLLVWVAGVREGLSTFGGFGRSLCVLNWPETSVQDLKQEDENSFVLHFSLWMTYFGDVVKSISAQLCEALSGEVGEWL